MGEFQLLNDKKPIGTRFENDVDPFDRKACVDLLRSQASARGIPTGRAVLLAYQRGRKVREYRAT